MTQSEVLMQLQADVSGLPVQVSPTANLSALGAAHLAGLTLNWWDFTDLETGLAGSAGALDAGRVVLPGIGDDDRVALRRTWATAIGRSRTSNDAHDLEDAG
jgi:glycerol kinase